jgi:hypothetical protein
VDVVKAMRPEAALTCSITASATLNDGGIATYTGGSGSDAVGTQPWGPYLSGVYRCVHNCAGIRLVHIMLNGRQLDLTNESGQPSTASIEAPGYIWTQSLNEGAVYSPDGFTIQFHGGKVWVLVDPTPAPGSAIWY